MEDRRKVIELVDEALSAGCLEKAACKDLELSVRTIRRWRVSPSDQRQGPHSTPKNKLSEDERARLLKVANSPEFANLPPTQIVPRLADRGVFIASEATFYKILREEKLLTHRGKRKAPSARRPKPLVATASNQIYSWDITYLRTRVKGLFFYLYFFMDIHSRKIVGFEVHPEESMDHSSALIKKICIAEDVQRSQLVLHSDNGSPMKGLTMLAMLDKLGVEPSLSRPSVSNDNPFSESLFKTLKYCPEYPSQPFLSLDEARSWVSDFVIWYNTKHLHSGIKFVTPEARHQGLDQEILNKRKAVYREAKKSRPERWSRGIRDWEWQEKVYLNHLQQEKESAMKGAA